MRNEAIMCGDIVHSILKEAKKPLPATEKAHELHLTHKGFGRWANAKGQIVAYTDYKTGKLVMKKPSEIKDAAKSSDKSKKVVAPKTVKPEPKKEEPPKVKAAPPIEKTVSKQVSDEVKHNHIRNLNHITNSKIKDKADAYASIFKRLNNSEDAKKFIYAYNSFVDRIDTPTNNTENYKDVVLAKNFLYYAEKELSGKYKKIKAELPKRKCKAHLSTAYKVRGNNFKSPTIKRDLMYLTGPSLHDIFSTKVIDFKTKLITMFEKYRLDITNYYGVPKDIEVADMFNLLSNGNRPIYDFAKNQPKRAKSSALFFNKKVLNKHDWELYSVCMLMTEAIFNLNVEYNKETDEDVPILRVQFVRTGKKSKKGKVIPRCSYTSYYKMAPKSHLTKWNKHDIKKEN